MRKILKGFSLVELMVALIVVSCITAALTPLITKKLKSSTITVGASESSVSKNCTEKFGEDCSLCYTTGCILCTKTCDAGEVLDSTNCVCKSCNSFGETCLECNETSCTRCSGGYGIQSGLCVKCSAGYVSDGLKECTPCQAGNYQANEGQLSCNPCPSGKYQDEAGKSSCKTCDAGTYQTESGKTSCNTCEIDYACSGGASHVQCATGMGANEGSSACSNCPSNCKDCNVPATCLQCNAGYYISNGGCVACPAGNYCDGSVNKQVCAAGTYAATGSSSCVACSTKTANCVACDSKTGECSECDSGYKLNSSKKCVDLCDGIDCGDYAKCLKTSDKTAVCMTKYNMGDALNLEITLNTVNVVTAGSGTSCTPSSTNFCCWKGTTSKDCDSANGGYSGCTRTLCSWHAANALCSNLNYRGKTWRLPKKVEMQYFETQINEISVGKGANGVMFCDNEPAGTASAKCGGLYDGTCAGAANSSCYPVTIWSEYANSTESFSFWLSKGYWGGPYYKLHNYALGVRCVSDVQL